MTNLGFLILYSTLVLVFTLGANASSPNPFTYARKSVNTPFGVIRGETISPGVEDLPPVTQFLGIPYGLAPNGQYRFSMAISAAKWTHQAKDALKNPPVCIQSGFSHLSETEALRVTSAQHFDYIHRVLPFLTPQSEDCLYLNIFVPESLEKDTSSHPMPVLVLVHGSEYGWGSGNFVNGSILAATGRIVVVTVNYRLDIYGFLGRCEANSCTGNAGISDLVAALKMLTNILPALGADPQLITLIGDKSGASLISLLMASPITQPKNRLFKRAILLDGSALSPWAMTDHPQQYFMRIAQELQCIEPKKLKDIRPDQILQCLQFHTQQNVTAAARKIKPPSFLSSFAPIVDGQIVPNSPKFLFSPKFGSLFRNIDLMAGIVSNPAHHLLPNLDLTEGITQEKRDRVLRTLVRNLYDYHRKEIYESILNEYTDWENPKNNSKSMRNLLLNALNDVLYTAPLIETIRSHSTDEAPRVSNTYFYVFAHKTTSWNNDQLDHGVNGALSDDQLFYIFGYPLFASNNENVFSGFKNDDQEISKVMMRYVYNFAKTGDPSKPQQMSTQSTIEDRFYGIQWPEYSQATREAYLEISDKPRVKNYYRNSFAAFWNNYIPKLNRGTKDRHIDEEHHFLPNHFNRHTFYGVVRPYSSFHNDPFPPPPPTIPPFPNDVKKPLTTALLAVTEKTTTDAVTEKQQTADTIYHALVAVLALGVMLLVINVCCYIAFFRKYMDVKRGAKKPVNYQSYLTHAPTSEVNYLPNAPLNQQLMPTTTALTRLAANTCGVLPMPPSRHASHDETSRTSSFAYELPFSSLRNQYHLPKYSQISGFTSNTGTSTSQSQSGLVLTNGNLSHSQEQEPLLAASSKSPTPALIRTGISPTCPRHGGQAAQMIASRVNSIGSTFPPNMRQNNNSLVAANSNFNSSAANLEEVQV